MSFVFLLLVFHLPLLPRLCLYSAYLIYLNYPFPLCPYSTPIFLVVWDFVNGNYVLCRVTCGSMCLIWMHRLLQTCRANDGGLTVCDRHNVMCNTNVEACVKSWFPCSGPGMSILCCVCFEANCFLAHCYEHLQYEKDLSTVVWRFWWSAITWTWSVTCLLAPSVY